MRCLVTGGAGFIGSHVVDALLQEGHEALVVDDLSKGNLRNLNPRARFEQADIGDQERMEAVFSAFRPEAVFHLAAQIDVGQSIADPAADAEENVMKGLRLLALSHRTGVQRFVFSSSGGAIYGDTDLRPTTEDHPEWPESPYGIAKLAMDKYLAFYAKYRGLPTISLRYGNVYGPRQIPHGEACAVAIFMQQARSGRAATIYGDGMQTRDFVYVGDVAHANLLALQHPAASGPYNIGTGVETTVNDLWTTIAKLSGAPPEAPHDLERDGGQRTSCLDCSRARRDLGWTAQVSLQEGLRTTWEDAAGQAS